MGETANPLQNKVAIVTGGAKRVGRAIALRLASAGMHVAITYQTSGDEARDVVEQIQMMGRRALAIQVDLAEADGAQQVHDCFIKAFDRCDALVNNASCFDVTPFGKITAESFDHNMAVNARSPLLLMQLFAEMLGSNYDPDDPASMGRIVNFIDIHVMGQPLKLYAAYNCSKAALMEATMTMAMILAPKVTVNALAPGVVAWAESYTEKMRENYMQRVPLARPGTPEDAATAALFLIRDAHYSTGQIIRLDGGRFLT